MSESRKGRLLQHPLVWSQLLEQMFEDAPLPLQVLHPGGEPQRENATQKAFNQTFGLALGIGDFNQRDDARAVEAGHAERFVRAAKGEVVSYGLEADLEIAGEVERFYYERILMPVGEASAGPNAVLSIIVDVTDERRNELERERLAEQMMHAQKLESLGVLAGGIAHDFNNVLMGVVGHTSLLLGKLDPDSPLRRHALAIEAAARSASDVAQQMLAYAGRSRVEKRSVDLTESVRAAAELVRMSAGKRALLSQELSARVPLVHADPTQVQQVLVNLITNGAEAMEGRGGMVTIRTGAVEADAEYLGTCRRDASVGPGKFAYLEVEDQGVGMDADTLTRVFDPFFSTKFTGRGLGMSSVLGIVRGHGGLIRVLTEPDEGTVVRVHFPAVPEQDRPFADDPTQLPRPVDPGRALVIDDEELVRGAVAEMLRDEGFEVVIAEGGERALEVLRQAEAAFDVAVVDMTMPGMDGADTLAALRALQGRLPVVMMSGYDPEEAGSRLRGEERLSVLQKPFGTTELVSAIRKAMEVGD